MRRFRNALFCLALGQALLPAADTALLSLVMPDAKVIAGAQVNHVKNSPFGAFVLSHMQIDDPDFQKFMAATGFDPRRDLSELLIASNSARNDPSGWLILAKGTFDAARIQGTAKSLGGAIAPYKGMSIISLSAAHGGGQAQKASSTAAIAFLDPSTAAMGTFDAVEAAIDRRIARAGVATGLAGKVQQISSTNDFWFTTLVPLSEFADSMPDSNLAGALKGNLLQNVQQASGGVKFGSNIVLSAEIMTRSPQDASALVDVVKFIAGLIQTNRESDKTASKVSTVLDALRCSAQGNVMTMSLSIPEAALEQMMDSMLQERRSQTKKNGPGGASPNK
jgi:hypothetical protein